MKFNENFGMKIGSFRSFSALVMNYGGPVNTRVRYCVFINFLLRKSHSIGSLTK